MVTDERGQLLLVAAITVAVFIVSFSVVFNSVVFTEQRTGGDADVAASGATLFNHEVRETTSELLIRINHASVYNDSSAIHDAVQNNTSRYNVLLAESYGDSSPVSVNVTYDEVNSTLGSRVVQRSDGSIDPTSSVTDRAIGWFTLNVNASETESFEVTVDNQSNSLTYDIERNSRGPGLNITTSGYAPQPTVTCQQTGDRVLFDLVSGSTFRGNCTFPSFQEELTGPYDVTFDGGTDETSLRYELVVNGTGTGVGASDCSVVGDPTIPCRSDAVWTAHVVTEYDRSRVSYERAQNVSVYGGGV
ncbi:hypothetical protein C453_08143 [Haloferax elongans ATCC BAA-1513]|uniref:Uncharacterized protein n=1 Tax=Haloferax elongans ATCC BAA-1513 TaxID=1230453 RepID=M0HMG0_HALEO|nr:hypothetical protein [Haloferax elongans]ELZ85770.1 hypothetical protein C453_08143 [Haloferax elongans ATCC BAA-1513]